MTALGLALSIPSHASAGIFDSLYDRLQTALQNNGGAPNLVTNGGFEKEMSGWNYDPHEFEVKKDSYLFVEAHSGRYFVMTRSNDVNDSAFYQDIFLKDDYSDLKFNFSVWMGGDAIMGDSDKYAEIIFFGESENDVLLSESIKQREPRWHKNEINGTVPEGASRIRIKLCVDKRDFLMHNGAFDDVELTIAKKSFVVNGVSYMVTKEPNRSGEGGECSIEKCPQGRFSIAELNRIKHPIDGKYYNVTGVRGLAFKGYNFGPEYKNNPTTIIQLYQMKTIGHEAFAGCSGVAEFWLNSEKIERDAFKGYTSVKYVYLGSKTKQVKAGAFSGCTGLKKVRVKAENADIADGAFPAKATIENK